MHTYFCDAQPEHDLISIPLLWLTYSSQASSSAKALTWSVQVKEAFVS